MKIINHTDNYNYYAITNNVRTLCRLEKALSAID